MIKPMPVQWTQDQIARFWDYYSSRDDLNEQYFARMVGTAVVNVLELADPLRGRQVLDYGCGPGHLAEKLLARQAIVTAADFSPESVAASNARLAGRTSWRGAVRLSGTTLPWSDDSFEVVCCLETIEHVPADVRQVLLDELRRVLRPGGIALFTTPNDEDLRASTVCCPGCGAEFHRVQHLHRYTAEGLCALLTQHGFRVRYARGIDLVDLNQEPWEPLRHWSAAYVFRRLRASAAQKLDRVHSRPVGNAHSLTWGVHRGKHLVALASKR